MAVKPITATSAQIALSGRWILDVKVTDDDGCVGGVAPTMTVTLPDGSSTSVAVEARGRGVFRGVYVPAVSTGRYTARAVAAGYGVADFVAWVDGVTPTASLPTVDDVRAYAGKLSQDDETIADALITEADAQRNRCRVSAVYPADLREALIRRVVINLGKRKQRDTFIPDEVGARFTPTNDPEVRRLEAPYRKAVSA